MAQDQRKTLVNTLYFKTSLDQVYLEMIAQLQQSITAYRTQNFTGALLQNQTMTATKFISKWIEEKNKG